VTLAQRRKRAEQLARLGPVRHARYTIALEERLRRRRRQK
jgi:hypothetical protein